MNQFHQAVYIFENSTIGKVKVGMIIGGTSTVEGRLKDLNDKWLQFKGMCQVCGNWRLLKENRIPVHQVNGKYCVGGNQLPMEKDIKFAEKHLLSLKQEYIQITDKPKSAISKYINNLKRRINLYKHLQEPKGKWQLSTIYWVEDSTTLEKAVHRDLNRFLDKTLPIGEIFLCSVEKASYTIEQLLGQDVYQKEVVSSSFATSYENGACSICGGPRTDTLACPSCIERYCL